MASFHEIGAHLKLVAHIKDLANKMKHMEGIRIVLVLHHLTDQLSQNLKTVLDDRVKRQSILVQLKFKSRSQSKEPLETSVNALSAASILQVLHDLRE